MKFIILYVIAHQCYLSIGYGYHRHDHVRKEDYNAAYLNNYQVDQSWGPSDIPEQSGYQQRNPYDSREDGDSSGVESSRPKYTGNNIYIPGWMQQFTTTQKPTTTERSFSGNEFTAACIRSCPVTSQYNPVCGTDNVTYQNAGRLECAQNCGVRVQVSRPSACSAPIIPNQTTTSTTIKSTIITRSPSTITTPLPTIRTTTTESYVNGNGQNNNGNTDNSSNVNVGDNEYEGNYGNDNNSNKGSPDKIDNGGSQSENGGGKECNCNNNAKKPSVEEVMACTQLCPLSSEYNPVCGTDGITYSNPGRLLCSQYCGIDVKVQKFAPCSSNVVTNIYTNSQCPTFTNPTTTESPATMSTPGFVQDCLKDCPASEKFSPVCGTNNITYQNLDRLNCAKRCGLDVGLLSTSACSNAGANVAPLVRPTDPSQVTQDCIRQCSFNPKYEPICGTDNITYNNTGHLYCARQCGVDVQIKTARPCSNSHVPSSTSKPPVTPNPNGLNFTIPSDLLASVFPNNEDENIDIDKRFKEENN